MKNNNRFVFAAVFLLSIPTSVNAALVDRGGGLIYDTDLNITWLADANYAMTSGYDADGAMPWSQAMKWVGNLSYGGYTDWRLPTTLQPDATCSVQTFSPYAPYSNQSIGYNCTGSEMGHLFYTERDNTVASFSTLTLFTNVQLNNRYWSGTEYAPSTNAAWRFGFGYGDQDANDKSAEDYAWAVHDGDVGFAATMPTVPIPAAFWLFGSGLVGLFGFMRRRKK